MCDAQYGVHRALAGLRFIGTSEAELQDAIGAALASADLDAAPEVVIAPGARIDFLVEDVGIEAKVDGGLSPLTRQLHRYAQSPKVSALVVVTTRMQHARLPATLNGKDISVVHVGGYL